MWNPSMERIMLFACPRETPWEERKQRVKQSKLFVTVTRATNDGFADDSDANDSSDLGKRQLYLPTPLLLLAQNRGWLCGRPEPTCWRRDSGHLGWREHSLIPNSQRVKSVMPRLIIALSAVNHYDAPLDVSTIQYYAIQQLYCQVTRAQGMYQDAKSTHSRIHARDHVKQNKNKTEEAMRVEIHACLFLRVQTSV